MKTEYIILLIGIGLTVILGVFAPDQIGWGVIFVILPCMVMAAEFIDKRIKKEVRK